MILWVFYYSTFLKSVKRVEILFLNCCFFGIESNAYYLWYFVGRCFTVSANTELTHTTLHYSLKVRSAISDSSNCWHKYHTIPYQRIFVWLLMNDSLVVIIINIKMMMKTTLVNYYYSCFDSLF